MKENSKYEIDRSLNKKIVKKSPFIDKYREEMVETLLKIHPEWDREELEENINEIIIDNLQVPEVTLDNNYTGETRDTNLISVFDWIIQREPLVAGNGTFYKNQNEAINPVANMLDGFLKARKAIKKEMFKVEDKTSDLYKDLDLRLDLKRYKSKLKILDNALGILLNGLEEKGILEDTVIVMFGDHYPYGLSTDTLNTVLDYDTNIDYEAERVPFVIYNSGIEHKVFSEYTSYINILPTILNLFGVEHDPRFYMGTDLLSEDYESMVVFADGSWKNEYAYYNASKSDI